MRGALAVMVLLVLAACGPVSTFDAIPSEQTTVAGIHPVIELHTNKGVIVIELDREAAPQTVPNILSYVEDGFYDGTVFHRVIKGFMIQGGGFAVDGTQEAGYTYTQKEVRPAIPIESDNGLTNKRGTVAMARTNNPNSATSQFFINTVDNDFLNYAQGNPGYTVFGRVLEGMDAVDEIEASATGTQTAVTLHGAAPMSDWPTEPIIIEKAVIR